MDVTGAEALRRRIEKQAAIQRRSEPDPAPPEEPPARENLRKGPGRRATDVRPWLKEWIDPAKRPEPFDPRRATDEDGELNGGGAGALNRRLAERRASTATESDLVGESELEGGSSARKRRVAERRSRYSTVGARRASPSAFEASFALPELPTETSFPDPPELFAEKAPAASVHEAASDQPPRSAEPREAAGDEERARREREQVEVERRQMRSDGRVAEVQRRQVERTPHVELGAPRAKPAFPHLPTVAFSVVLSVAAALAVAFATTNAGGSAPGQTVTVTKPAAPTAAGAAATPVPLHALASYNPYGTGPEHSNLAGRATDRNPTTFWSTETYQAGGFKKPGTGLVFASEGAATIAKLEVVSDTPGFQAQIRVSDFPDGGFEPDSSWQTVTGTSIFDLKGRAGRYWMVWLRLPRHEGSAHLNEIRALS